MVAGQKARPLEGRLKEKKTAAHIKTFPTPPLLTYNNNKHVIIGRQSRKQQHQFHTQAVCLTDRTAAVREQQHALQ